MCAQTSEIPQVDDAGGMGRGLASLREKIPFIGMRRNSHHLIRSMLESGTSLKLPSGEGRLIFFSNLPTSRRTVEAAKDQRAFHAPLLPLGGGRRRLEWERAARSAVHPPVRAPFSQGQLRGGYQVEASIPKKPSVMCSATTADHPFSNKHFFIHLSLGRVEVLNKLVKLHLLRSETISKDFLQQFSAPKLSPAVAKALAAVTSARGGPD